MKEQEIVDMYVKRITELRRKLESGGVWTGDMVESAFMGGLSIVESLYGVHSSQAREFREYKKTAAVQTRGNGPGHYSGFLGDLILGALSNTKEELEAGLIRNLTKEAAGKVIGDLVTLAKAELKDGFTQVAAVLASAALEDALKRKAGELGLDVENKSLEDVINALKSKSFFRGAQTPIVTSFVRLRNYAMHAEWKKIQEADVTSLIGFLEPFLLEHFS
ncbi:MAG TPA: hypothetical protein VMC85_17105 [Desulfomonilaceae bacterium]|nr:hypothetical protein [Desulfomonilaceae bacterium]